MRERRGGSLSGCIVVSGSKLVVGEALLAEELIQDLTAFLFGLGALDGYLSWFI